MFTGIIEEMGTILEVAKGTHSAVLTIAAGKVLEDVHIGDSIAVNGVCLTVTSFDGETFTADVMHETLNRSSLAQCKRKSPVNLERAMPANGRFGGHIVEGHVDGTGQITEKKRDDNAVWIRVEAPPEVLRYVVEKGSVTIDGISLTVAAVTAHDFSVSVIPHTAEVTTLGSKKEGDIVNFSVSIIPHTGGQTTLLYRRPGEQVNLETDIIGKYVEKLLHPQEEKKESHITREFLENCGF